MDEKTVDTTAIVPAQEVSPLAQVEERAAQFYGEKAFMMFTSLPLDKKAAIARAMGDSDYNIKEEAMATPGLTINIQNVLNHMVDITQDDGSTTQGKRTVLIDDQGRTWSSVAEGVVSSLGNLFNIYGLPPYNPPLKVQVRQVKTRRGFYTMNLVPVED